MTTNYKFTRVCKECGESFGAQRAHAKFCGDKCRKSFHNRAAMRGRECYHFLMTKQYDRNWGGKGYGEKYSREILGSLVQGYRESDIRHRGGRPSWFNPKEATEELGRLPACCDDR